MEVYHIFGNIPGKLTEVGTRGVRTVETKVSGELKPGTLVRMKSGSQGWIRGEIVEYYDVLPVPTAEGGGYIYGGGATPGYKVRVLEGKHQGEVLNMPMNYIEVISGGRAFKRGESQFPHIPQKKIPLYPHK